MVGMVAKFLVDLQRSTRTFLDTSASSAQRKAFPPDSKECLWAYILTILHQMKPFKPTKKRAVITCSPFQNLNTRIFVEGEINKTMQWRFWMSMANRNVARYYTSIMEIQGGHVTMRHAGAPPHPELSNKQTNHVFHKRWMTSILGNYQNKRKTPNPWIFSHCNLPARIWSIGLANFAGLILCNSWNIHCNGSKKLSVKLQYSNVFSLECWLLPEQSKTSTFNWTMLVWSVKTSCACLCFFLLWSIFHWTMLNHACGSVEGLFFNLFIIFAGSSDGKQ